MTVSELRRRMTSKEWVWWQGYYAKKWQQEQVAQKRAEWRRARTR